MYRNGFSDFEIFTLLAIGGISIAMIALFITFLLFRESRRSNLKVRIYTFSILAVFSRSDDREYRSGVDEPIKQNST